MVRVELGQSLFMCFNTLYNIILALIIGMAYIAIALLYCLFRNGNLCYLLFRDVNIFLQESVFCKGVMINAKIQAWNIGLKPSLSCFQDTVNDFYELS